MAVPEQFSQRPPLLRLVGQWLVLLAAIAFGGAFILGGSESMRSSPALFRIALDHFAATVGLPSAALAALCIVIFLESTGGAIEFEGLGFKFRGASGPIVLWVFCFLAIAGAIKLLW